MYSQVKNELIRILQFIDTQSLEITKYILEQIEILGKGKNSDHKGFLSPQWYFIIHRSVSCSRGSQVILVDLICTGISNVPWTGHVVLCGHLYCAANSVKNHILWAAEIIIRQFCYSVKYKIVHIYMIVVRSQSLIDLTIVTSMFIQAALNKSIVIECPWLLFKIYLLKTCTAHTNSLHTVLLGYWMKHASILVHDFWIIQCMTFCITLNSMFGLLKIAKRN